MDEKYYIGIDPGQTGAMAIIHHEEIQIFDYADECGLKALQNLARGCLTSLLSVDICLEQVHAFPGQGVSSTFKFGMNYGIWIGRLESLQLRHEKVTPQSWQKVVVGAVRVDPKARKDLHLEVARRLFPGAGHYLTLKKHHNRADALLIAQYCLQKSI